MRVQFIGNLIRARDVPAMTRFYVDALGLNPSDFAAFAHYVPGENWSNLTFGVDGMAIDILDEAVHVMPPSQVDLPRRNAVLPVFAVDDLVATVDRLRGIGVEVTSEITTELAWRFCYIRDPEGNDIELCEFLDTSADEPIDKTESI